MSEDIKTYRCSKCKEVKPTTDFSRDTRKPRGHTVQCKKCRAAHSVEYYKNHPEKRQEYNEKTKDFRKEYYQRPEIKLKHRKSYIERTFNMPYSEYERMLEEQDGTCAICNKEENCIRNSHLAVDHNHETGVVRGLLCTACNTALGLFRESLEILEKAKNYLSTHYMKEQNYEPTLVY